MQNHQVLYRKYRPQEFKDVIGQDSAVALVSSAVSSGKPSHAYLFIGARGLGKTTVARIFARDIGCRGTDLYEMDGASRRKIDDIREVIESVKTLPMQSKYKVYIIDEVHMLTNEAFNALLKTLEEPPAHAIFILATTDDHKIPQTIRSRCQVVNFNTPNVSVLTNYILDIAKKESIKITHEAASILAYLADGSYRDACGRLEEAIIHGDGKEITEETLGSTSGIPQKKLLQNIIQSLALPVGNDYVKQSLDMVMLAQNINYILLLNLVLNRLRSIIMLRHGIIKTLDLQDMYGEDESNFIQEVAKNKDMQINSALIIKVIDAINLTKISPIPSLPMELLIVRE
jgi:DNA polymerase-3 subunit gamma/tau